MRIKRPPLFFVQELRDWIQIVMPTADLPKGRQSRQPFFKKEAGETRRLAVYLPDLLEPPLGIEPRTYCLRNSCSTTELRRQIRRDKRNSYSTSPRLWRGKLSCSGKILYFSRMDALLLRKPNDDGKPRASYGIASQNIRKPMHAQIQSRNANGKNKEEGNK